MTIQVNTLFGDFSQPWKEWRALTFKLHSLLGQFTSTQESLAEWPRILHLKILVQCLTSVRSVEEDRKTEGRMTAADKF